MMNRAYSILNVKSFDPELRMLRGTATTPTPDRLGDIIEPLGVKFAPDLPLLWQHKADKPVGTVRFGKPTKNGIDFEARIEKSDGVKSETLRERLDEAWESVKLGLVRAVSIGFRPMKDGYEFIKDGDGGIRFTETEVMELSLVTIPANSDATINQIKSVDSSLIAASGTMIEGCERPTPPGVAGKPKQVSVKAKSMAKTIKERIAGAEASLFEKSKRMEELMTKADDELLTLDETASEEYDTCKREVESLKKHLERLRDLDVINKEAAKPIEPEVTAKSVVGHEAPVRVQVLKPDLPVGTKMIRYCMAIAAANGNREEALRVAEKWKDQTPEVSLTLGADIPRLMRAQQSEGTTTSATWASPLIVYNTMQQELIALLRPLTILGRIPGLRRVPFNISMPQTTSGTTVGWVGESAPKPVSQMAFATVTLRWAKAAGIVVLSDELVRFSNPSAEAVVRQDLTAQMAQFLDAAFVSAAAEVTNVSPAGILNGVTGVTPTGTTASAFRADVKTLFATFLTNNLQTNGGVWLMTQQQALSLAIMQNSLGQPVFPTMNDQTGGSLLGYPVVASENIAASTGSPTEGYPLIFLIASEIMLADDGQVVIDASNQASVQMESAPDSPPSASTNLISLWQLNMTALRAERWINWKKRRTTAVAFIDRAKYSE